MENKNESDMSKSLSGIQGGILDKDIAREGLLCCQDCGKAFKDEAANLEHRCQHGQDSSRGSDSPRDTRGHIDRPLFCGSCSLSFVESSDFHSHMLKHRGETPQVEPDARVASAMVKQHIYECPDCGKCYGVFGHFLNHQRSHRTPSKSVFHELEQLKKKSFKCETCGRSYSRVSALDAHRRCHEGKLIKSRSKGAGEAASTEKLPGESEHDEKQPNDACDQHFKCSCGKAFLTLSRLKTHQRFSRNSQCSPETLKERPKKAHFYCSECDKNFSGRIALVQHQRWHANHSDDAAKKFPCAECGKIFMTLTFYYKHQRMVHSKETPAKSFLHQVHQLQKKAFECKDCGLKFSRASALQAHQLHHTDVFRETEKVTQRSNLPLPQQRLLEGKKKDTQNLMEEVVFQVTPPATMTVGDSLLNDIDEDVEGYETGDFKVEIISASESEDESQDLNPDLELVCESDQDLKDDLETTEISHSTLVLKPEMDLKIVQIDYEQGTQETIEVGGINKEILKKRQATEDQTMVYTCDICGHETNSHLTHYSHIEKHNDEKLNKGVLYQPAGLEKRSFKCDECGKLFSRMSALISHQLHHPKRKPHPCPDCMMSYSHASGLYNHRKVCSGQKKEGDDDLATKKVFNPKKTLLGPKIYHCDRCGKGFWSLGAYSHHKQSPTQCLDLRQRKGTASLRSVNGHSRSSVKVACPVCGQKFRHKGIMKSHMRKHENGNHKCELCGRSFRVFSSLLRHQVVHSAQLLPPPIKSFQHQVEQVKKNTYSCPDCGKLFSRAKALQFHMKSHGYETQYSPSSPKSTVIEDLQCSTCLSHFNNKSSLRAHQKLCIKRNSKKIDGTTPSSENIIRVKNCRELSAKRDKDIKGNLASEAELKDEMNTDKLKKSSTSDLKYKCKECERSFSVIGALNFHKRIHLQGHKSNTKTTFSVSIKKPKHEEQSKAPFYCLECGRRFTSNSALGTHKRWHTDKKFVGSLVKDESNSLTNKAIDEGPFQCKTCGKRFFYLCVFRRHQLYYPPCQVKTEPQSGTNRNTESEGKTPCLQFKCSECNKLFVRGSLLAAHYKRHHKQNSESANDKEHQSQIPQDKTQEQIDLNSGGSEAASSNPISAPHQCPHCSMSFAKIRGLRAHKWQAHSKGTKAKKSVPIKNSVSLNGKDDKKKEITTAKNPPTLISKYVVVIAQKKSTVGKRKKSRLTLPPLKSILCLDCGKGYSSAGALYNHRKVCVVVKQERRVAKRERRVAKREIKEAKREIKEAKRELKEAKREIKEAKRESNMAKQHNRAPKQDDQEPKQDGQMYKQEMYKQETYKQEMYKQETYKQEMESPEAVAAVPQPLSRQPGYAAQFLFKCNKCGKAFQTEEHLESHRTQARSRPYCCALCCQGFWTETQLQQHLAWHDEVRQRLPIELRYRLSAAMTSRPPKPHGCPSVDAGGNSTSPSVFKPAQSQTGHKCQHCGKAFLSPAALQKHEAQHSSSDSYHCSLCPRTFSEIQDLIDHHQECMGDDTGQGDAPTAVILQDINGLTCLECGTSFSHETELHQHYVEHAQGAY